MSGSDLLEEGYDGRCVDEIVARGPLYLGKELLAASFLAGVSALSGVFLVGRRALTIGAAIVFLLVSVPMGSVIVFVGMAPGLVQAAYVVGIAAMSGAIVLARSSPRRATMLLSVVYLVVWAGLLALNAAEGHRLAGSGVSVS